VVRIGLRNTWVKTKEGHIAVIGNTSLSGGPLTNHSATERLSKKYAIPIGEAAQPLLGPELVGGERKVGDVDEDAGHPLEQG